MTDQYTYESTSSTFDTPQGKLHYHDVGQGPPLLLLHGSGPGVSGWANFRGNLPVLAEHFRTLVLDMPGFGASYPTEGNPALAAGAAVLEFLDGMGLDKVSIIGNSMGGGVAARLAAEHPDRVDRLVTIGGVGIALFSATPPEGIKLLVEFVESPTRQSLMTWMESMVFDRSILTDEFVELRWNSATNPAALESIRKMYNRELLENMRNRLFGSIDSVAYLSQIQAPTLITWGRDDRVTPLDAALLPLRLIPKCELHTFYDCGHWAMIERKQEFESAVTAFLRRG